MRAPFVIDFREFTGRIRVFNKVDFVLHPTPLAPTRILNSLHDSIPGIPSRIPASYLCYQCQSVVRICLFRSRAISCGPGHDSDPGCTWGFQFRRSLAGEDCHGRSGRPSASLLTQWLISDAWLHRTGPLRIVGTCIATAVTFVFALRWQYAIRERQLEMVRRMEMICAA